MKKFILLIVFFAHIMSGACATPVLRMILLEAGRESAIKLLMRRNSISTMKIPSEFNKEKQPEVLVQTKELSQKVKFLQSANKTYIPIAKKRITLLPEFSSSNAEKPLPVFKSIISPDALNEIVYKHYNLNAPFKISFLKEGDNDHYLLESDNYKYVLRVYRCNKHWLQRDSDYLFEMDLLTFLHKKKFPVAYPIQRKDLSYVGTLLAPEGIRYWALFSFAEGDPMEINRNNCYEFGEVVSKFHLATNNFTSYHERINIDQKFLVDNSIERINTFTRSIRRTDLAYLDHISNEIKLHIKKFSETVQQDEWGVIGGDFHGSNHVCSPDREMILFDFDLCGYGWRAYDISIFKWAIFDFYRRDKKLKNPHFLWHDFLKGYEQHRRLSKNELKIIPLFVQARQLWLMGSHTTYLDLNLDKKYWNEMFYDLKFPLSLS